MAEAKQFNPVNFDAKAIAKLAKDAGMKYVVITSKHQIILITLKIVEHSNKLFKIIFYYYR